MRVTRRVFLERLLASHRKLRPVGIALLFGYPLLFIAGYQVFGMGAIMLGLIPTTIAAWGWTRRTALLSTVLAFLAHMWIISWFDSLEAMANMGLSYIAAHGLIALMAGLLGTLFDQYRLLYGDFLVSKKLNADLEAYTRTVAHDLKNPLASFASGTELLRQEWSEKLDDTSMDLLDTLEQQSYRMLSMVDGLLRLAQVENQSVELIKANPSYSAYRAWVGLKHLQQQHDAEIEWPAKWPEVYCFPSWLEEVWDNLLSNAIKYGGNPPKIAVTVCGDEDFAIFGIHDNGTGIAENDRDAILKEFSTHPETGSGSYGIGLTIVQRILDRFGSGIEIATTSKFPSGTCFRFKLPLKETVLQPSTATLKQSASITFQKMVVG